MLLHKCLTKILCCDETNKNIHLNKNKNITREMRAYIEHMI